MTPFVNNHKNKVKNLVKIFKSDLNSPVTNTGKYSSFFFFKLTKLNVIKQTTIKTNCFHPSFIYY
jgi:hypothetical protein